MIRAALLCAGLLVLSCTAPRQARRAAEIRARAALQWQQRDRAAARWNAQHGR